ncbi:MAG: hypothetical protein HC914_16785 [Chloroflexaceae bacterium]|nr:hypothetical protein [Chloroflexaceae bacterium]
MVGFWFNAPDGTIYSDEQQYNTRAAKNGRADWEWIAPVTVPVGVWQVVAEGQNSGISRSIFFEIVPPNEMPAEAGSTSAGVEPDAGPPNTQFAFFAEGFAGRELVSYWTIRPDGTTRKKDEAVRANADGRADWFWSPPREAEYGMWQMVAQGRVSGVTHVIVFEIVPE